jgi:hypothetical protein
MQDMQSVVVRYLGDATMLRPIESWLSVATQRAAGTASYGRPATRRAALKRAASRARGLQETFGKLVIEDQLRAFGPLRIEAPGSTTAGPGPSDNGVAIAPPQIGLAPILMGELASFLTTLAAVEERFILLAAAEPPGQPGAPPIEDSLILLVEQLAAIWTLRRGSPPDLASRKTDGFASFIEDIIAAGGQPFQPAQVRTAVRRFFERRPTPSA